MSRHMKDSGIVWIGKVPVNWQKTRLKRLFVSRAGGHWGKEARGDHNDRICLRVADFNFDTQSISDTEKTVRNYSEDQIERLTLEIRDILLEKSGGGFNTPVGRTIVFHSITPSVFSNFIERLRPKSDVCHVFIGYLLKSIYQTNYIESYIKQTTGIQNLDVEALLGSGVFVPDVQEQRIIEKKLILELARIDRVISLQEEMVTELQAYKQSIITEAVTKGLNPNVPMKDSKVEWIGKIPSEWTTPKTVQIFDTIGSGTTPKSTEKSYYNGTIHWIQSGDLTGDKITNVQKQVSSEAIENIPSLKVHNAPFIVIAMYGASIANTSVSMVDACVNQACCVFSNTDQDLQYLFYAFQAARTFLVKEGRGGTQPNISQELLRKLRLPLPGINDQREIAKFISEKIQRVSELITAKRTKVDILKKYKQSLIYECVTGKRDCRPQEERA